jgi:hypothetical protein
VLYRSACAQRSNRENIHPCPLHRQLPHPALPPAMDGPSGTPPTPSYSIPPPPPLHAPNPSDGAAAGRNSAAARILFVPPRPVLHTSAAAMQLQPPAPTKRKATASRRSTPVADVEKPTPKSAKTTAKAAVARRVQHPPPPQSPVDAPPPPPPPAQVPSAAMFGAQHARANADKVKFSFLLFLI